ncbi:molybdate ABC transporter substrate-binding protein [Sandarakinorhabdus sp. AAP62]|uniref:molybdate ABC transporter substrate-binding protein n=1 Tax=Sandarakinorhabdus sp. AAP62 TaxID=1248916 RepID=UPI00030D2E47|nr:molybdate ABC transporter substrate-binding protein [Sandarakinorhabdus sp. AAP62]
MIRLFLLLLCLAWPALAAAPVPVAAAADLRLALPPLVRGHEARTGHRYNLSFGSSGQMVQQALNGAPFQLLLLADASHADRLAAAVPGVERRPYALGRLALVATRASGITDLASLKAAIRAGRIRHLAIANPAHAPYGVAARAVLAGLGVTGAPLVLGENVAQALSFVSTGAAEVGLVALPLARAAGGGLIVVPVSPMLHPPLVQTLVLMPGATPAARGLADRLTGPNGRAALARAGFGLP